MPHSIHQNDINDLWILILFIIENDRELVTVWTALALHQFRVSGHPCSIEILGVSASLISLADDSRSLK